MRVALASLCVVLLVACGASGDAADAAGLEPAEGLAAETDAPTWPPAWWFDVPECPEQVTPAPWLHVTFAPDTPPDWRAGPATVDALTDRVLELTFLPDGPQVTATFENAPDLRDAAFAVGDTVDATAFAEDGDIIHNNAFVIWHLDGALLLYAEHYAGFSNATGWRGACDTVHPCPVASLQEGAVGCRLPDDDCVVQHRRVPISVATDQDGLLVVESAGAQTLTTDGVTWSAVARGATSRCLPDCVDCFDGGFSVVVFREP